ncbi:hypothetical protein GGI35DRAFT_442966 [Trichoderma velutinum]
MQGRTRRISTTITRAIVYGENAEKEQKARSFYARLIHYMFNFFYIWSLDLKLYQADDFLALRCDVWHLDNGAYTRSFQPAEDESPSPRSSEQHATNLVSMGSLGYSGSTFFKSLDGKYLVKSLDRHFEHHFFTHELLTPYMGHMREHPGSLLVRITDLLQVSYTTLGSIFGTESTHHVVMENLLYGTGQHGDASRCETYDLKPKDYFFPERDIASGNLVSQSVKNKLVDHFPGKVQIAHQAAEELMTLLDTDTKFLADFNVVDYSLFLVRYPRTEESTYAGPSQPVAGPSQPVAENKLATRPIDSWRTGVVSSDEQWVYRAVVLDFFWARHKFHARTMSSIVGVFNIWAKQGPMTITTEPFEYRKRFMKMVQKLLAGSEWDE